MSQSLFLKVKETYNFFVLYEKNVKENIQVCHVLNVNKDGNKLFVYFCKNYLKCKYN